MRAAHGSLVALLLITMTMVQVLVPGLHELLSHASGIAPTAPCAHGCASLGADHELNPTTADGEDCQVCHLIAHHGAALGLAESSTEWALVWPPSRRFIERSELDGQPSPLRPRAWPRGPPALI